MSGWSFAWDNPDAESRDETASRPLGRFALAFVGLCLALPLLLYATGLVPALGSAEGSERHDRRAVYFSEDSSFGLSTMYVRQGQRLWWDYDVTVEGRGGVRVWFAKSVPSPDFSVRMQTIDRTGRGRFEVVAPESGFYSFDHELVPSGVFLTGARPGSTNYRLSWGVD